jgi:hypothetical protein
MELAILMVIAAVIGGGVAGGLLTTWQVHRRLFRLEYAQNDTERILTRETKKRAADGRWSKDKDEERELLKLMETSKAKATGTFDNEFPGHNF